MFVSIRHNTCTALLTDAPMCGHQDLEQAVSTTPDALTLTANGVLLGFDSLLWRSRLRATPALAVTAL